MIRAAFFDVDGLVIVGRKFYFSECLSKEHNIPLESIQEFFFSDFNKCALGAANLKEELAPYLLKWNWKGSVEDLLTYWFESESTKDEEVLAIVKKLREKGIKCYLATRQEKYRMQYLLNDVGLKDHFDGAFSTCDIKYEKWQPEFFTTILGQLDLQPSEALFFDDGQKNVDAANALGMHAHFYDRMEVLQEQTKALVS